MKTVSKILFFLVFMMSTHAKVILIDPGHGGEDCGAKGKIWEKQKKELRVVCEKEITLGISKKIQELLKGSHRVYLTRSVDREISLDERARLADKINADIFISVHINSSNSKISHGFETYYLDNHKDIAVKRIEEIENKSLKGENLIINQILIDLVVERTAPKSKKLAGLIHKNLKRKIEKRYGIKDRGIKPALFYVLALSKRPAVLLEVGFLSNEDEVRKILSPTFQKNYAQAVVKGIKQYLYTKSPLSLF